MTRSDADLGSDPGTALRATMNTALSDIRIPTDLLDRAVGRTRRRTARNRVTAAAAAVATVAAVATAIATVPGWSPRRPASTRSTVHPLVQTAAYVLEQAAAAQLNSYHMISVDREPGSGTTYTDLATQQQRSVSQKLASSGQPYFQIAMAIRHGVVTQTTVDYQHHVWSTLTSSSIDHGQIVSVTSWLPLQTNADPAVAYRQALKAGNITVVGHRRLHGRDTILILVKDTVTAQLRAQLKKLHLKLIINKNPNAPKVDPREYESWIWVDARTYLVVQTEHFTERFPNKIVTPPVPGCSVFGCKGTWVPVFNYVTWLPHTPKTMALLTVTPPTGFTKIPYSELAQKYLGPIS
jgi:hypothetical protein